MSGPLPPNPRKPSDSGGSSSGDGASGKAGIHFLFGNLVNFSVDGIGFVFALNVLPLVVFFSALIAVLYYLGIMQLVIRFIGGT